MPPIMSTFTVQFDVTVATVGSAIVTVPNIQATDAAQAISTAQAVLVTVVPINVIKTA